MNAGFWILLLTVLSGVFIFQYLRMLRIRSSGVDPSEDTGAIILAFSRAYPNSPIREILQTEDRGNAFLRTAEGAVGLVQVSSNYRLATLIEPGSILVEAAEDDRTIRLHFSRDKIRDGAFTFATVADAAEVSLWLCGNFVPAEPTETAEPDET